MTFAYTDLSDDRLTAEPGIGVDGAPVVALIVEQYQDTACVHIPLDRVEELVAGVRDTARQAGGGGEQPPAAVEPSDQPRLFHLQRDHDVSGVSGTGRVANGVLWPDGTVSLRWIGERPSTVHWDRLEDAEHVHGHGGATRIVWADEQPPVTRALVLREAADVVGNDDDCDCGGCDSCVPNKLAAELRRMADEANPMVGSFARDGFSPDEIAEMLGADTARRSADEQP